MLFGEASAPGGFTTLMGDDLLVQSGLLTHKETVEAEEKHHLKIAVLASGTLLPHLWLINWQAP